MSRSSKTGHSTGRNAVPRGTPGPAVATAPSAVGLIDLFTGIGCVADGFASQGFEPLALLDVDADARRRYLHNFPDANYLPRDVSRLTASDVAEFVGDGVVALSAG